MCADDYLPPDFDSIFGEVRSIEEQAPGVYYIIACEECGEHFQEYYIVANHAPFFAKISQYGKKLRNMILLDVSKDDSGWRIAEYELCRYMLQNHTAQLPKEALRDIGLHAAEHHPEYFGRYPVPVDTPWGYTLRHWALENGIYWLETDECAEGLTICSPIWQAELSISARWVGIKKQEYLFFTACASCIPIFELMRTRQAWDGTLIDRQALMNAIWEYLPQYALAQNRREQLGQNSLAAIFLAEFGIEIEPKALKKELIAIFPDKGTDFLRPPAFSAT